MSHYSNNPGRVRVDLFKPGGKWYATGSIDMGAFYGSTLTHEAVYAGCCASPDGREGWPVVSTPDEWLREDGTIVCLAPYHVHAHPVMLTRGWLLHRDV